MRPTTYLVQALIPYTGRKAPYTPSLFSFRYLLPALLCLFFPLPPYSFLHSDNVRLALLILLSRRILLVRQIHLVDEHPNSRIAAIFPKGSQDLVKVFQVGFPFGGRDVKDVDQDGDVGKDGALLGGEVVVDKGILAAAVPKILRIS